MRHRRAAATIGAALIVGSCGVDAESWTEKVSKAECDYAKRCDRANFFYLYEDEDSCRNTKEFEWGEVDLQLCAFDQDAARDCMNAFHSSCKKVGREYQDLVGPCFLVWDCGTETTTDSGTRPL